MRNKTQHSDRAPIKMRYTQPQDVKYLKKWLADPEVLKYCKLSTQNDINVVAKHWIEVKRPKHALTATIDKVPCGVARLHFNLIEMAAHFCFFDLFVEPCEREDEIRECLVTRTMEIAKTRYQKEVIQLWVIDQNPALKIYKKLGFKKCGEHPHLIKDKDAYRRSIFLEKFL